MWRKRQAWLLAHPAQIGNIVFIDETGINTRMARLRGRCLKGRRMVAGIPHGHWKTMTFIAGLRCDGLTAPWVIEGAMDGDAFEQSGYEDEGTVAVKPRRQQKRRLDPWGADILGWIEETPDMTLHELSVRLQEVHGVRAPQSTIDDWLRRCGISFKKNRTRQRTGAS